ncbi:MAG: CpsD/CapB family tyrosine-protein kinase, partial [Deltaproteobacteria bacterium]|nr:CpsD/CapB family tyrosine-protein kinase [Deltaproteobacteria bacterium]
MSKLTCEPVTKAKIAGILAETGRIYASIQAAIKGINNPVVVVSSAVSQEGKSLFTAGLGICAARNVSGRVLLIDAHWHAPMLHSLFDLSPQFAL